MIKAEKLATILNEKNNGEIAESARILNKVIGEFEMEIEDKSKEIVNDLTDEIMEKHIGKTDKLTSKIRMNIKYVILYDLAKNLLI